MDENQNNDDNGSGNLMKYTGMGFQMIFIIGIFTYAGYKIDEWANHNVKWATAILSLAGVFISLYVVIRAVKAD